MAFNGHEWVKVSFIHLFNSFPLLRLFSHWIQSHFSLLNWDDHTFEWFVHLLAFVILASHLIDDTAQLMFIRYSLEWRLSPLFKFFFLLPFNCIYFIVLDEYLYNVHLWNAIYNDSRAFFNCYDKNTLHSVSLSFFLCRVKCARQIASTDRETSDVNVLPFALLHLTSECCTRTNVNRRVLRQRQWSFLLCYTHDRMKVNLYFLSLSLAVSVCDCLLAVKMNWINCNLSRQLCSSCNCWCEFYSH